jgi:hypothetical protein
MAIRQILVAPIFDLFIALNIRTTLKVSAVSICSAKGIPKKNSLKQNISLFHICTFMLITEQIIMIILHAEGKTVRCGSKKYYFEDPEHILSS